MGGFSRRRRHRRQRVVAEDRSVTPEWPRVVDLLHRSAGGVLLSLRSWSIHRLLGRPGRRFQLWPGRWPWFQRMHKISLFVTFFFVIKLWRLRLHWRVVTAQIHFSFQPAWELSECQWCRLHFRWQTVPRWRTSDWKASWTKDSCSGPRHNQVTLTWRSVETVETGVIIDTRFGAASVWLLTRDLRTFVVNQFG